MRYSTYRSIYESAQPQTVRSHIGDFEKKFSSIRVPSGVMKICIVFLIILAGCSTVLTVFAGEEQKNLLAGDRIIISQGDTLWGISLEHKPEKIDTRVYIEAIKNLNGLHGKYNVLQVGQVLQLPRFEH